MIVSKMPHFSIENKQHYRQKNSYIGTHISVLNVAHVYKSQKLIY